LSKWIIGALLVIRWGALHAEGLPFIQDDFSKARTVALKRNVPIFVECWAPW